jgi:hypothetical protein
MLHAGPCGRRVECWRAGCRSKFLGFATVEVLGARGGHPLAIVAYCHRQTLDRLDLITEPEPRQLLGLAA